MFIENLLFLLNNLIVIANGIAQQDYIVLLYYKNSNISGMAIIHILKALFIQHPLMVNSISRNSHLKVDLMDDHEIHCLVL